MTDDDIVKALECCVKNGCRQCPYMAKKVDCVSLKRSENDALNLIHRLQEENAELRESNEGFDKLNIELCEMVQKQKTEIERLTEKNYALKSSHEYECEKSYFEGVEKAREQAVKDTAKEILQSFYDNCKDDDYGQVVLDYSNIESLARQFGVEVE